MQLKRVLGRIFSPLLASRRAKRIMRRGSILETPRGKAQTAFLGYDEAWLDMMIPL